MYYTIYKTTNLTNDKIYIGYHSTEDLNDTYLGSGKALNQAIKRDGLENFTKEILYIFPTKEEALDKEAELVNESFVASRANYNLKIGGEGGWDHTWNSEKRFEAIRKSFKEGRSIGWNLTDEQRSKIGKSSFKGKKHSIESRKKIGDSQRLNPELVEQRIEDFNNIEKKYGYISRLAKQWQISHTSVRRFLKQNQLV